MPKNEVLIVSTMLVHFRQEKQVTLDKPVRNRLRRYCITYHTLVSSEITTIV